MESSKVVVVTGASAGIGRATVRAFAERGYDVGLIARGIDGLEAAAKEVEAAGARAHIAVADVSDAPAVERAADDIERALGPIDVWVNNAMTSVFAPFIETSDDEFRRVTDVTYHGFVFGTRAALKRMKPRDRGVIVQVGSALAYRAIPLQSAYCGAKHAMKGFTQAVRTELLHDRSGVRICMVQLPAHNTPQFDWVLSRLPNRAQPVPPIYQPEVAAEAIVRCAEHPRREVWVGLAAAATIAANKIVPGLLDRYLARTGVAAQQTDEPADEERRSNLWEPLPGDHGAHGRFDARAHGRSIQQALGRYRRHALLIGSLVGAGIAMRRRGKETDPRAS